MSRRLKFYNALQQKVSVYLTEDSDQIGYGFNYFDNEQMISTTLFTMNGDRMEPGFYFIKAEGEPRMVVIPVRIQ